MFFSVVIPVYNKEKELRSTLESVLNQSFSDFEILLIDDGSTDNSISIIKDFQDARIRLISQSNQGVSAARNRGVKNASCRYIALLDADDKWEATYLKEQYELIQKYPQCSMFAVNYSYLYTSGEKVGNQVNNLNIIGEDGILEDYFYIAATSQPPICSSAIVIEKSKLEAINGFPIGITSGEDLLTWAKLAYNNKIAYSKKNLSIYILREELELTSMPTRFFDSNHVEEELISLLKQNADYKYKSSLRKYIGLWFKMKSSTFFRGHKKRKCWIYGCKSIYYNPTNWGQYIILALSLMPVSIQNKAKCYYQTIKIKNARTEH